MIDHLSAWDYDKLTYNYRQGLQHGGLIQQLYDYSTRERFNLSENQVIIQQDPVWQTASSEQRSNVQFQSHLLLRSLRAQRLQEHLGETVTFSNAAVKIKQDYLAKTYPMLSAADKATLQSTELGRSLAKLCESLQISEQFLEDAALIAAYGPEFGFMFSQKVPVKVRIIHSSCTKLEFSSKNLCKPKMVGGHLNHDGFLQ